MNGNELIRAEAQHNWDNARRKALWSQVRAYVQGKNIHLVDFDEVSSRLKLRNPRYKGVQDIPLEQIVGSVGRYNDFVEAFLPTTGKMEERWERIATLYLDPNSHGVPPIEAYKVGEMYFVKDGNHRVSVAKQLELASIEAYVWEYPLEIDTSEVDTCDIDALLLAVEKQDFLTATQLDTLIPKHELALTLPGGYQELLDEIADYQHRLDLIDQEDPNFKPATLEDATKAWYELVFEPSIRIIKRSHILEHFPNRTPADLFIWLKRRRMELEEQYGHNIRLTQAIKVFDEEQHNRLDRLWRAVSGWIRKDKAET